MNDRKRTVAMVAVFFITALFVLPFLFGHSVSAAEKSQKNPKPITLHFANFEPPVGFASPPQQAFADELEKRTNGKYKVEIAWGGAMGKIEDHYDLVRNGVSDFSYFLPTLTPGVFPMSDIISLPWILPNAEISVKAMWELYKVGYLDKEYTNIKPLFVWAGPGQQIFSANPIESLEDISGKKLISHSEINNEILTKAMNAVPVFIPHGEMYGAVQKGIVDGMLFVWVGILPFNLQEVVRYYVDLSFGNITCVVAMNNDSYRKLPREVQNIMSDVTEDTMLPLMIKSYADTAMASQNAFDEAGGKKVQWPTADMNKMNSAMSPLWTEWITKKEKQGLPAREAVHFLYNTLKKLGIEQPAIGYQPTD
jgi:TRAP-type C4-dicarboxylate transport system substrate-binding protein